MLFEIQPVFSYIPFVIQVKLPKYILIDKYKIINALNMISFKYLAIMLLTMMCLRKTTCMDIPLQQRDMIINRNIPLEPVTPIAG